MSNPNYYSILTADLRYNKKITDSEKILYSEITALSNKNGYCHANNNYFAKLYDVSTRTIQNRLKRLKDYGFIKIILEYYPNSQRVKTRRIYITNHNQDNTDGEESFTTPHEKTCTTPTKNASLPHEKSFIYNNTRVNNIKDNTTSVCRARASPNELINLFNEICISFTHYKLNPKDNPNINKLIKSDIDIIPFFKRIESSDYLTGRNGRWLGCNFSWIIKPENSNKILAGCYDNPKSQAGNEFFDLVGKDDY